MTTEWAAVAVVVDGLSSMGGFMNEMLVLFLGMVALVAVSVAWLRADHVAMRREAAELEAWVASLHHCEKDREAGYGEAGEDR